MLTHRFPVFESYGLVQAGSEGQAVFAFLLRVGEAAGGRILCGLRAVGRVAAVAELSRL